jgi:TolB-like protein/DNA-binding SARP family transcriptional activator/Tfp pilus assembly protein PilF
MAALWTANAPEALAPMFRLRTLGPVELEGASDPQADAVTRGPKRLALLVYLAVDRPRGFKRRDALAALLWPELDQQRARHALRNTLHELRKALGDGVLSSRGSEEVALSAGALWCDLVAFDEMLVAGKREEALMLYRGPFLDGFHAPGVAPEFEHWVNRERDRLTVCHAATLERLAEDCEARGDFRAAAEHWRVVSAHDSLDGRVVLRLMLALEAAGDRAQAIRRADAYSVLLREELGADPDPEVAALAARLREVSGHAAGTGRMPRIAAVITGAAAVRPASTEQHVGSQRARPTRRVRGVVAALLIVVGAIGGIVWRQAITPRAGRSVSRLEIPVRRYSLAVLPLKNYSGDPAQEDFAAGMTDELTTTLAKIEALHVIAHQSVRQFKDSDRPVSEIAQSLGVGFVVDGSVVHERDRVRISVTLIDAATNAPVWAERFERERSDVLALQRELSLAIARAVAVALTPEDRARLAEAPAVDPEAFDLYIKGTQARYRAAGPQDFAKAVNYFTGAIVQDSTYAPAYAGLAFVYAVTGNDARARQFADKALALDPTLAEAHMVLGMVRHFSDWDWAGSEAAFREAIQLNPGYAEAHHELSMLLMRRKRFDEALREAQRALYLAPTSARFEIGAGEVYLYSGRYDEALEAAGKALAVDSINAGSYLVMAYAYGEQERYDEAAEAARKCIALGWAVHGRALLGYVYAKSGRRVEALKLVDTLTARWRERNGELAVSDVATGIAEIYAGLGDSRRALDWLERSVGTDMQAGYLGIDPTFRSLHSEPRFGTLLKAVGLKR